MLYSAKLTSIKTGLETTFVGSCEQMEGIASRNGVSFRSVVGPATDEEILGCLARLDNDIAQARTQLDNSSWSSGPRHRGKIADLQSERLSILRDLPSHLSARVA